MLSCDFDSNFFINNMEPIFIRVLGICISNFENSCLCLLLPYGFLAKEISTFKKNVLFFKSDTFIFAMPNFLYFM